MALTLPTAGLSSAGHNQPLWSRCSLRSVGLVSPSSLCASQLSCAPPFHLSASHRLTSLHSASLTSLAVDAVEWRYLLSADAHGLLALYDTQPTLSRPQLDSTAAQTESTGGSGGGWYASHPLTSSTVSRPGPGGGGGGLGGSSVNSVVWYPVDTGLFVTGGQDGGVHVWDTNSFSVEASFTMRDAAVNCVAMSPLAAASTHSLIAVASTDLNVRLCDVHSGGFAHTLIGHQAEVTCACWTPFSEFILATASVDRVSTNHPLHTSHSHSHSQPHLHSHVCPPSLSHTRSTSKQHAQLEAADADHLLLLSPLLHRWSACVTD